MRILKMIIAAIMGWNKKPAVKPQLQPHEIVVIAGRGPDGKTGRITHAGRSNRYEHGDIFYGCDVAAMDLAPLFSRLRLAYKAVEFRAYRGVDRGHESLWLIAYSDYGTARVASVRLVRCSTTESGGNASYNKKCARLEKALLKLGA